MPYPALLQRAVPTVARPTNCYALSQAEFPREFAELIHFVGATPLDKETGKIERRLQALKPTVRAIYGDRYFFEGSVCALPMTFLALASTSPIRKRSGRHH